MTKKLLVFFMACALALVPALAVADDLLPPAWRGTENTIYAIWDNWTGYHPTQPGLIEPDFYTSNPGGVFTPYLTGLDVLGVVGESIVFKTTGIPDPVLLLKANNFDRQNPEKWIRLQMTFDYGRDVLIQSVDPAAAEIKTLAYRQEIDPDTFYSAWDIILRPNPYVESIYLVLPGSCNFILDQVVLDTKCVVPLPGSLLLLGSGILGLITIGRRRN